MNERNGLRWTRSIAQLEDKHDSWGRGFDFVPLHPVQSDNWPLLTAPFVLPLTPLLFLFHSIVDPSDR